MTTKQMYGLSVSYCYNIVLAFLSLCMRGIQKVHSLTQLMTEYALVTFQHNPIQKKCFWRSVFPKPRFYYRRILNLGPPATFSVDTILIVDKLLSFLPRDAL